MSQMESGSGEAVRESAPDHSVTIIIPAYNAERHIRRCLRSALSQSLPDLTVIVVDDASTDNTAEVVRSIASQDARVRLISLPKNGGQGPARNIGINAAGGKYVWFLDADDAFCNRDFLQALTAAAEADGADMVRGQKHSEAWTTRSGWALLRRSDRSERFFSQELRNTDLLRTPDLLHNRHFYNFLYRRAFLNEHGIRFVNPQWEERPFLIAALLNARIVSSLPIPGYVRTLRFRSTSHRPKELRDVDLVVRNIDQLVDLFLPRGAADQASPLHFHYLFTLSHMLGIFFRGFPMQTLRRRWREPEAQAIMLAVSGLLRKSALRGDELVDAPLIMRRPQFYSGVYAAAFECLRAGQASLFLQVLGEAPIATSSLSTLTELDVDARFLATLNRYMKEHQPRAPLRASPLARLASHPRVIVHIGSTKTGSTYLQHLLDANRIELLKRGVWYPDYGVQTQPGRPHKTSGHSLFGRSAVQRRPGMRNRLLQTLTVNKDIHTVILSSEAFFLSGRAHRICNYLAPLPVQVLVYLRRQDEWVESQYREFVAGGARRRLSKSPIEWLNSEKVRNWCRYDAVLAPWASCVGPGNLIVRPFEPAQLAGGNLSSDFAAAAGISFAGLSEPPDEFRNNVSLEPRVVLALRRFNDLPFPSLTSYLNFISDAAEAFGTSGSGASSKSYVISAADRRDVLRRSQEANSNVARNYLGRQGGELFLDGREPVDAPPQLPLREEELDVLFKIYARHAGIFARLAPFLRTGV